MDKEARYKVKKVSRKEKKSEPENEGYIQELRVPTRSRRQTQSGDEGIYHEISPSPGRAYNVHKYETRTPEEYISRTASGPRIIRKISEPTAGLSHGDYERAYRQNRPRHSSWVEYEEDDEVLEEVVRDAERRKHKDARQEAQKDQEGRTRKAARGDYSAARASEGEQFLEFEVDQRSRTRRRAGERVQTDPEAGRDSIASVQRASVNLLRLGADDPREYMELKYGVLVEPNEKSLEEIEREVDFEKEIKRSSVRPVRHQTSSYATASRRRQRQSQSRLHEMEMRMEMDAGRRMKMKLEPEVQQLFSDSSDLSSGSSDSSDDEQIQAMLQAAAISDNVCIPDTPYEPQTEEFRREKERDRKRERFSCSTRPTATEADVAAADVDRRAAKETEVKAEAAAARQRTQSLRDLEQSIREREAFVASQEEALLRRQAALEERERKAAQKERELDVRLRERRGSGREEDRRGEGEEEGESSRRRNLRPRAREYEVYDDILDLEPPTSSSRSRIMRDTGDEDPWYGS